MVKVSVILPTYNSADYLQNTLDSIQGQHGAGTLFELELIVVDDCSVDQTTDILRKNHIQYISNTSNSKGPNKGRNIGLRKATGEYICLIDHDDTWHPEKILLQLQAAKMGPIVTTGYHNGRTSFGVEAKANDTRDAIYYPTNETFLRKLKKDKHGQPTYMSSILIHSRLKDILFEENFGLVDFDWLLKLFDGNDSVHIPKELVIRNTNGRNLSLDLRYRLIDYHYSLLSLENYQQRFPKEVALAVKRINGTRARYHFLQGEMAEARKYFRKSAMEVKTLAYFLSTYYGSRWVIQRYNVFG